MATAPAPIRPNNPAPAAPAQNQNVQPQPGALRRLGGWAWSYARAPYDRYQNYKALADLVNQAGGFIRQHQPQIQAGMGAVAQVANGAAADGSSGTIGQVINYAKAWAAQTSAQAAQPRRPTVEHSYYDQIRTLSTPPSLEPEDKDFDKKINKQTALFVENSSRFAIFKAIESLFKLPEKNEVYFSIIKMARERPDRADSILRDNFFALIDDAPIIGFFKIVAKLTYRFFTILIPFFVKRSVQPMIAFLREQIETNSKDQFTKLGGRGVKRIDAYFANLRTAFEAVSHEKYPSGGLDEMLMHELGRPERNKINGKPMTQEAFYRAIAEKGVDRFVPQVSWAKGLDELVKKIQPFGDKSRLQFIDKTIQFVLSPFSAIWWVLLILPEKITNALLRWGVKRFMSNTKIIDNLLDVSIESVANNNYVHALNILLCKQLQAIVKEMNDPKSSFQARLDKQSNAKEIAFKPALQQLFGILELSACRDGESVKSFLHNPTLPQKLGNFFNWLFIEDTVEIAGKLIAVTWESIAKKEDFKEHLANFLTTVNDSFTTGTTIPADDFEATERQLVRLSDEIISIAIEKALSENLDISPQKLRELSGQYVKDLKEQVIKLVKEERRLASLMTESLDKQDFGALERQLGELHKEQLHALAQRSRQEGNAADSTTLKMNNLVGQLDVMNNRLREEMEKVTNAIAEIRRANLVIGSEDQTKVSKDLHRVLDFITAIDKKLAATAFTADDVAISLKELAELRKWLPGSELKQRDALKPLVKQIEKHLGLTETAILAVQKAGDQTPAKKHALKSELKTFSDLLLTEARKPVSDTVTRETGKIKTALVAIRTSLDAIAQWETTVQPIPIPDVPLDTATIRNLLLPQAKSLVKTRVDGLFEFIRKPYNYRHGVFGSLFKEFLESK